MKTKFTWLTLIVSAALISHAHAGRNNGGGQVSSFSPSRARSGTVSSYRSMPMQGFGGSRMIYSGQRFSPGIVRPQGSTSFRQHYASSNGNASISGQRFNRFSNGNNQLNTGRQGIGAGQLRSGNSLPANWRNHVVGQHAANWHRDWDRNSDHFWQGHRCRFFNGAWFIFDFGFDPWWPYWYPYDYYGYGYPYGDSYGYDPGYDNSNVYQGDESYGQNGYEQPNQNGGSSIAAVQERLAREGYYRGKIDGVMGPATRHALVRYQSNRGLPVSGILTPETRQALGLGRVASY